MSIYTTHARIHTLAHKSMHVKPHFPTQLFEMLHAEVFSYPQTSSTSRLIYLKLKKNKKA